LGAWRAGFEGGPVTLALRALRPSSDPALPGAREWLIAALHSRATRLLTHPLVALALYVSSLYGMYFTGLYETALRSHAAHLLMYAHFLAAGYLFFWLLIGVDRPPRPVPHPLRLPLLFASMVFHAFFRLIVMQSDQLLASDWYTELARPWDHRRSRTSAPAAASRGPSAKDRRCSSCSRSSPSGSAPTNASSGAATAPTTPRSPNTMPAWPPCTTATELPSPSARGPTRSTSNDAQHQRAPPR